MLSFFLTEGAPSISHMESYILMCFRLEGYKSIGFAMDSSLVSCSSRSWLGALGPVPSCSSQRSSLVMLGPVLMLRERLLMLRIRSTNTYSINVKTP